jgi:hypothetical protein
LCLGIEMWGGEGVVWEDSAVRQIYCTVTYYQFFVLYVSVSIALCSGYRDVGGDVWGDSAVRKLYSTVLTVPYIFLAALPPPPPHRYTPWTVPICTLRLWMSKPTFYWYFLAKHIRVQDTMLTHQITYFVKSILHTSWLDNYVLTLKRNTAKYYFGGKSSILHTFLKICCELRKI